MLNQPDTSGHDRITQLLREQSGQSFNQVDPAMMNAQFAVNALNPAAFLEGLQKAQGAQVKNQQDILAEMEAKVAAGDKQAKALEDRIKLFAGDDPQGAAMFLQELHNDPEEIDPSNSYQVMTKLASIAKRAGYVPIENRVKEAQIQALGAKDKASQITFGPLGAGFSFSPQPSSGGGSVNNPGNMRPVGESSGFQQFATPEEGLQAMRDDLTAKITGKSKAMMGQKPTLQNLITTWAPPVENDTANYIKNVSAATGIAPDQVLTTADIDKLMPAMIKQEHGAGAAKYLDSLQKQERTASNAPLPMTVSGAPYTSGLKEGYQWALGKDGNLVAMQVPTVSATGEVAATPQTQMSQTVSSIKDAYDRLHQLGADISTKHGRLKNITNYAKLTGPGQVFMKGTKQQEVADEIGGYISGLLLDIKSASGAGARQFDSDKDVQFMQKQATSLTNGYEANMKILNNISMKYTGKPIQESAQQVPSSNAIDYTEYFK